MTQPDWLYDVAKVTTPHSLSDAAWERVRWRTIDAALAAVQHYNRSIVSKGRALVARQLAGDPPTSEAWWAVKKAADRESHKAYKRGDWGGSGAATTVSYVALAAYFKAADWVTTARYEAETTAARATSQMAERIGCDTWDESRKQCQWSEVARARICATIKISCLDAIEKEAARAAA